MKKEEIGQATRAAITLALFDSAKKDVESLEQPFILFLSGLQGSGKTSIAGLIKKEINVIVVSADGIRHALFAREIDFSPEFPQAVDAIKLKIIASSVAARFNIIVDENATQERLASGLQMVRQTSGLPYKVISVLLKTTEDELFRRLGARAPIPDQYTGKVEELAASIEQGPHNESLYTMVIDTGIERPNAIAKKIIDALY